MSGELTKFDGATVDDWAARITACWRQSVEAIIATGRLIAEAKDALDHGEYLALVQERLPFGARTAQRLVAVASDPRILNATHGSHLPASWRTLYELTRLDDDTFGARIADGTIRPDMDRKDITTVIKTAHRAAREQVLGGIQHMLPKKRYGVILADPEWRFEVYSRETGMDRAADNHYPTSTTDAICQRDVASIAADDCVLFLWTTAPMLPDALKVMAAWGFTYKSQMVWCKDRIGTGYWFRNAHEILLVGSRGNPPAPAMGTQWKSFQTSTPGTHSTKPDWQYGLIEEYFPTLPKIELNARRARAGWDAWGFEAPTIESEPEAQRDDTALNAAPASQGDEPSASAMSSCSHGDGATDQPHGVLRSPQNSDDEESWLPKFLRRQPQAAE